MFLLFHSYCNRSIQVIGNMIEEQRNAVLSVKGFIQKAIIYHECFIVHIINNLITSK